MKVRVKYCGGCNPRYDRKAEIARLRSALPEAEFVEHDTEQNNKQSEENLFDHVIVICGCQTACASHDNLRGKHGKTVVSSQDECQAVGNALRTISP